MGYTTMKKFIVAMLALGLMFGSVGCTSSDDATETSDNAELAEDATSEISDMAAEAGGDDEFGDFSDAGEVSAEGGDTGFDGGEEVVAEGGDDSFGDDSFSDEGFSDEPASSAPIDEFASEGDGLGEDLGVADEVPSLEEDPFADSAPSDETLGLGDELAPSDANTSTDDLLGEAPVEDTTDYSMDDSTSYEDTTYTEAPAYKPLNKMLTTPYRKNGSLVNAIYIARPGDMLESVATKIYGGPRVEELRATNGHLASRDLVTGDKVYYNSPQRPADDSAIRVYYEDIGLNPEIYVSQPGDNIRAVGKTLLGDDRSWKELYATNMEVETKDVLDEGTRLRYWTGDLGGVSAPANVAANEPPPFEEPPPPPPMEEAPPMPDETMAANEPPPVPEEDTMAFEPPPPPPPQEIANIQEAPPPPPPVQMPNNNDGVAAGSVDELLAGDDSMTMIAGAIFILAAVAMFVVIRKRKAKKNIEFHTATHTQLE